MTRYVRAYAHGAPFWAIEDEVGLRVLTAAPWRGGVPTKELRRGRLLAPVEPSKIVCVASNWSEHAKEMGKTVPVQPKIFFKPPSAIVAPEDRIEIPPHTVRVDHEAELGVVIGRRCSRVTPPEVAEHIFGLTCGNDVTARDFQKEDGVFARAKGFDTFCPVGPAVVTGLDPAELVVRCHVNGKLRQEGRVDDMVFSVSEIIAFISQVMTLEPGDLVLCGTPAGVAPLVAGDRVVVSIDPIGELPNPVVDRADR